MSFLFLFSLSRRTPQILTASPHASPWPPRPPFTIATPRHARPIMTHPLRHAPQVLTATANSLPHASPWPPRSLFTTWESGTPSRCARLVMTPRHSAITTRPRRRVKSHCNINCDRATTTATLRQPCADNNRRRWDVAGHKVGPLITFNTV
ncbi:hypothetical protein EDB85DRAFT_1190656 [Lactarius pseudohatsudake]|nr:hypothetical protein EDB85DRAFT_1190656 [Lactarius pseudohatsudake]